MGDYNMSKLMPRLIPHSRPSLGIAEERAVGQALRGGTPGGGPEVGAFERDLEKRVGGRATATPHEGRFHRVRRMFALLRCEVTALHRDRIGELELPDDLSIGDCRVLSGEELALLLSLVDATAEAP